MIINLLIGISPFWFIRFLWFTTCMKFTPRNVHFTLFLTHSLQLPTHFTPLIIYELSGACSLRTDASRLKLATVEIPTAHTKAPIYMLIWGWVHTISYKRFSWTYSWLLLQIFPSRKFVEEKIFCVFFQNISRKVFFLLEKDWFVFKK